MSELMTEGTELTKEHMQAIFGRAMKPIAERKGITAEVGSELEPTEKKRGMPRKVKK